MIVFPNAKINLGLRIVSRRPDGYHNLETVMMPVALCDALEAIISPNLSLKVYGSDLADIPVEKNLVVKALRALEKFSGRELPVDIYLQKVIPDGAGLGGGSADASFMLKMLNELYSLGLSNKELAEVAVGVGADCPIFVYNMPMLALGIGDILTPVSLPQLEGKAIVISKNSEGVSTKEAYAGVTPCNDNNRMPLTDILSLPVSEWEKAGLHNDFEDSIFPQRPAIAELKKLMYDSGASYASMSGSGAAVYGIFDDVKMAEHVVKSLKCFARIVNV